MREEIIFELGDDAKLFSCLRQQAMALIVKTKRIMRLTQVWVVSDRPTILLDGLPDTVGSLQIQATLKVNECLFPLKLIEHCRLFELSTGLTAWVSCDGHAIQIAGRLAPLLALYQSP